MDHGKYKFSGSGLNKEQRKWGSVRFNEYLTSFPHLKNSGNVHLLEDLVWVETIQEWAKRKMAEQMNVDSKPGSPFKDGSQNVSQTLTNQLTKYREEITDLKDKLHMLDAPEVKDTFQQLQELFEKHDRYCESHPKDCLMKCPRCAKLFMAAFKTKDYKPVVTPFFEDNILHNRIVMDLYHKGVISKEKAAQIHGTNSRYIDWLDAKFYGVKHVEDGGTNFDGPEPPDPTPEDETGSGESAPTNQ